MSDTAVLQLLCAYCGKEMFCDGAGVTYYGSPGALDHAADADHVALDDRDYGQVP